MTGFIIFSRQLMVKWLIECVECRWRFGEIEVNNGHIVIDQSDDEADQAAKEEQSGQIAHIMQAGDQRYGLHGPVVGEGGGTEQQPN